MESTMVTKRCGFQWDIYNIFVPGKRLEATFYCGVITDYAWKVILEPMNRGVNHREFAIALAYNVRFETNPPTIVAREVEVTILSGDEPVERKRLGDIQFSLGNRYRHRFQKIVVTCEKFQRELSIKVEFQLTEEKIGFEYYYDSVHLLQLSEDMKVFLQREENTDLILWSTHNSRPFNVHSYIINFRWSNFFKVHRKKDEVETNISVDLLSDIITYMYCGDMPSNSRLIKYPKYASDLCRVVDRYKLEHLYKVLVKNDLKQHRMTFPDNYTAFHLFPLHIVENRIVNRTSCPWVVHPNFGGQYEIVFRMQVGNEAGNWLRYSLESRCQSRVYVEISLEVVKKEGIATGTTYPFHGRDLKLPPYQPVLSGPVLFLGCPETFGESFGPLTFYFISCHLNVSTGRSIQLLRSVDDLEFRNAKERHEVLSHHMRKLLNDRLKAKMVFISQPYENDDRSEVRIVHKEFFKVRVPGGWREIRNGTETRLPDIAICNMQPYTLPCIVEYIYTGKVNTIPALSIEEIKSFADRTHTQHLKYLVKLYASQRMNRR